MSEVSTKKKPYLKFVAYLQIIGIILVVFGHSFHELPGSSNGTDLYIYRLLFNVRMPLFTFVSGFLMAYTAFVGRDTFLSPAGFMWNKFKRLLIPFIVLSLVTFVPRAMLSNMADDPIELSWQSLLLSLTHHKHLVVTYYWFLQMSFTLLCFNYAVIYLSQRKHVPEYVYLTLLFAIFVALPMHDMEAYGYWFSVSECARLGIFFVAGIIYCHYYGRIDCILRLDKAYTMLIFGAIWICLFNVDEFGITGKTASICGILAFISLTKWLVRRDIRMFDHLLGSNYMIFLLSWYLNVLTQQILHHYTDMPWWVYTLLSLGMGIYVPWAFYMALQRTADKPLSRFLLFILGQNSRKSKTLKK